MGTRFGLWVAIVFGLFFGAASLPVTEAEESAPETACSGIFPGMTLGSAGNAGFVLRGADGKLYVTVYGLYVDVGDRIANPKVGEFGTVVWKYYDTFALVEIDASKMSLVRPAMCEWGGPTGTLADTATPQLLAPLRFYEEHIVGGVVSECILHAACTGYATHTLTQLGGCNVLRPLDCVRLGWQPHVFTMGGVDPFLFTGGGTPVITADGLAVGVAAWISPQGAGIAGLRMPALIEQAKVVGGYDLTLLTAPLAN